MQPNHLAHATWIHNEFKRLMLKKYEKGVQEHGGHLKEYSEKELVEFALDEAIDQVVYLITLRDKLNS